MSQLPHKKETSYPRSGGNTGQSISSGGTIHVLDTVRETTRQHTHKRSPNDVVGACGGPCAQCEIDDDLITTAYLKGLERAKEVVSELKREAMENIAMIHSSNQSATSELAYRDALSNVITSLTTEITNIKEK